MSYIIQKHLWNVPSAYSANKDDIFDCEKCTLQTYDNQLNTTSYSNDDLPRSVFILNLVHNSDDSIFTCRTYTNLPDPQFDYQTHSSNINIQSVITKVDSSVISVNKRSNLLSNEDRYGHKILAGPSTSAGLATTTESHEKIRESDNANKAKTKTLDKEIDNKASTTIPKTLSAPYLDVVPDTNTLGLSSAREDKVVPESQKNELQQTSSVGTVRRVKRRRSILIEAKPSTTNYVQPESDSSRASALDVLKQKNKLGGHTNEATVTNVSTLPATTSSQLISTDTEKPRTHEKSNKTDLNSFTTINKIHQQKTPPATSTTTQVKKIKESTPISAASTSHAVNIGQTESQRSNISGQTSFLDYVKDKIGMGNTNTPESTGTEVPPTSVLSQKLPTVLTPSQIHLETIPASASSLSNTDNIGQTESQRSNISGQTSFLDYVKDKIGMSGATKPESIGTEVPPTFVLSQKLPTVLSQSHLETIPATASSSSHSDNIGQTESQRSNISGQTSFLDYVKDKIGMSGATKPESTGTEVPPTSVLPQKLPTVLTTSQSHFETIPATASSSRDPDNIGQTESQRSHTTSQTNISEYLKEQHRMRFTDTAPANFQYVNAPIVDITDRSGLALSSSTALPKMNSTYTTESISGIQAASATVSSSTYTENINEIDSQRSHIKSDTSVLEYLKDKIGLRSSTTRDLPAGSIPSSSASVHTISTPVLPTTVDAKIESQGQHEKVPTTSLNTTDSSAKVLIDNRTTSVPPMFIDADSLRSANEQFTKQPLSSTDESQSQHQAAQDIALSTSTAENIGPVESQHTNISGRSSILDYLKEKVGMNVSPACDSSAAGALLPAVPPTGNKTDTTYSKLQSTSQQSILKEPAVLSIESSEAVGIPNEAENIDQSESQISEVSGRTSIMIYLKKDRVGLPAPITTANDQFPNASTRPLASSKSTTSSELEEKVLTKSYEKDQIQKKFDKTVNNNSASSINNANTENLGFGKSATVLRTVNQDPASTMSNEQSLTLSDNNGPDTGNVNVAASGNRVSFYQKLKDKITRSFRNSTATEPVSQANASRPSLLENITQKIKSGELSINTLFNNSSNGRSPVSNPKKPVIIRSRDSSRGSHIRRSVKSKSGHESSSLKKSLTNLSEKKVDDQNKYDDVNAQEKSSDEHIQTVENKTLKPTKTLNISLKEKMLAKSEKSGSSKDANIANNATKDAPSNQPLNLNDEKSKPILRQKKGRNANEKLDDPENTAKIYQSKDHQGEKKLRRNSYNKIKAANAEERNTPLTAYSSVTSLNEEDQVSYESVYINPNNAKYKDD